MDMDFWSLKGHSPRPQQVEIIDEISDALGCSYQNIILEAGTGSGKSAIATTVARMCDDSYILTMTKQLQNQYLQDFNYLLTEIKGRSNYACNYGGTCKDCEFEDTGEKKCYDCEYMLQLMKAKESPNVLTNYDYLYYSGNYAKQWDTRELLILDEAHNFEKKVMSLISENLSRHKIFKRYGFDIFESIAKGGALKNINNEHYWVGILEKCLDFEKQLPNWEFPNENEHNTLLHKYNRMISKLDSNDFIIELPLRKDIVADKQKEGFKSYLNVVFKPLSIEKYSNSLLHFGDTRLFMTGTLGSKDKFCEWNGLNADDTYYIYAKSPFPVENRPIIRQYVCSMRQEAWKNPHILKYIQRILEAHKNEKGVIHTSSNEQAWWIKKNLPSKRFWIAYGQGREQSIKDFEENTSNRVLIGAGLKDGVDFKGDKCRFQILFKVPYPSLGSQQVKVRKKIDPSWYAYNTVQPLQQAYGRGIRDEHDYCKFYVLDEDFEHLTHEYDYFFNEYFKEGIV